jgi:cell division protein FtsL
MACVLLLAFTVLLVLGIYVSAYAKLTEIGYQKTQLLSDLRALKVENDALRMKLDELRQPDRIAMFAGENGMEQSAEMAYITPPAQVHLAENSEDLR